MNYIYIIINPRFSSHSLINITSQSPQEINSGLNKKYANQEIENDFYKLIYVKEIEGNITKLSDQLKKIFKKYKLHEKEFYRINGSLTIEIIEKEFFKKEISDKELINWWNELDSCWKYTFETIMFPQTRRNDEGNNLDKVTSKELRELLLIDRLTLWREGITTLEPLKIFKELKKLNCSIEEISDLKPLSELYKLEELNIVDTKIESLEPISALLNLKTLYCFRTKIKSIKGILHLTNLNMIKTDYFIPKNELNVIRKNNLNCEIN
ncbi:hypothetical protein [Tenacibaculum dicentrarchi]|uniref:hypothetical protein n=1 Tax=Tenacibaculum dicentrarchi TaxID=669041 RepID=UPI003511E985